MLKQFLAATLIAAASFGAAAAETSYTLDTGHTFANFEINHLGYSTTRGRFNSTSGTIALDAAKKTAKVDISIDVNSIDTGVEKLDGHLKTADFFDAAKFPTITFKSTGAKFKGEKLSSLTGDLTMHGVTKPVTLAVNSFNCKEHPMKKTMACGADATAKIKRSDFGISYGVPAVGDEVKLVIQVEAAPAE